MRVTNNIRMRQYLKNYNRMNSAMLKSETRIETHRRYNRLSEDPINGVKALAVRRQLRDLAIYNDNLSSSKELFNAAEKNLSAIADEMYIKFEEDIVAATNGTHEQMELDIYAESFDQLADEMVDRLNGDFAERRVFGGTNNGSPAFRIGEVLLKGKDTTLNTVSTDAALTEEQFNKLNEKDKAFFNSETAYKPTDPAKKTLTKEDYDELPAADKEAYTETTQYTLKEDLVLTGAQAQRLNDDLKVAAPDIALAKTPLTDDDDKTITGSEITYPEDWEDYYEYGTDGKLKLKTDENGENVKPRRTVTYNGIPINFNVLEKDDKGEYIYKENENISLTVSSYNDKTGEWEDKTFNLDPTEALARKDNSLIFPGSKPILVDIGIGIKYNDDGTVDEQTALDIALNGASITGSGTDKEGYSQNLIQLILDSAYSLYQGDQDTANAIIDKANAANNHILKEITTLGTKQTSIDFYLERNEDYELNLKERQNAVEGTDMNDEITHWYNVQAAWDASLKMSSSTLPTSIFDFI